MLIPMYGLDFSSQQQQLTADEDGNEHDDTR